MKEKVILTDKRDTIITTSLLKKRLFVYNGKTHKYVQTSKSLLGYNLGSFSITKKLGKAIHDSAKNRKMNKKRNKK